MTWADAMGLVVIEGVHHHGAGAHRLPDGGLQGRPDPAQDRHRASASACSSPSSASSTPASSGAGAGTVPVELGIGGTLDGWPTLVFVVGLLLIVVLVVRKVKGAILIGIVVATVLAIIVEAIAKIGRRRRHGKASTRRLGA